MGRRHRLRLRLRRRHCRSAASADGPDRPTERGRAIPREPAEKCCGAGVSGLGRSRYGRRRAVSPSGRLQALTFKSLMVVLWPCSNNISKA